MKPILASDAVIEKLEFPCYALPKIDGVRGLIVGDKLVGRSGKRFANKLNTELFSHPRFNGIDGEMVVKDITGDGICSETTSALTTIKGIIPTRLCAFDYVVDGETDDMSYKERHALLTEKVSALHKDVPGSAQMVWVVPLITVDNQEALDKVESDMLGEGFEGVIVRSISGPYKYGRSTVNEGYYLRLKQFKDSEMYVTHVIEGQTNENEQTRTPNGYAERATLAENMEPNGQIGTVCGYALETVLHRGKEVVKKGDEISIGAGKLSHKERKMYFENQNQIIGKIAKFKFFPIGIKDKPRFATFQCFRDPVDM